MDSILSVILICLVVGAVSYLLGSCNMAILISKYHKLKDIRDYGSGNAGMTNMLRTFGKRAAAYTFAGDFLKGALAVSLSRFFLKDIGMPFDIGYVAAIFVVLGHIFPIYFKFNGGKGVATAFGAMLMLNSLAFFAILIGLVPMIFIIRIVSAVSLCGAAMYPVLIFLISFLSGEDFIHSIIPNTFFSAILSALTFYAHRENIKRFRNGTERFFGDKNNED